jgi:bacteriocin-like protein
MLPPETDRQRLLTSGLQNRATGPAAKELTDEELEAIRGGGSRAWEPASARHTVRQWGKYTVII